MLSFVDIGYFLIGIACLNFGSELLVNNGSLLAKKYNISKMIIGMTLLAFGTSLPEFLVSIFAIFQDRIDFVIGNVIGSNIANIGLVFGISSCCYLIVSDYNKIKIDILFLAITTISFAGILYFNQFSKPYGIVLIIILIIYIYVLLKENKIKNISDDTSDISISISQLIIFLILGILGLSAGSWALIEGATAIARYFNISEMVIGATAVALGTSLPELVTSLRAAKEKEFELVIGNIFGSNIINIVLVFGVTLLINDSIPNTKDFSLDLGVLISLTSLLILTLIMGKSYRFISVFFLFIYIYYISLIL